MLERFLFFSFLLTQIPLSANGAALSATQTPKTSSSASRQLFDAVSVKHLGSVLRGPLPGGAMPRPVLFRGGRLTARETLDHIIQAAFHLASWEYSGPGWLSTEYYEIQAIAPPDTPESAREQMLQAMLADRFSLKYHREAKQIPTYAITPGKGGITLPAGVDDPRDVRKMSAGVFQASAATILDLANFLTYCMDRPVFDLTETHAKYRMHFDWSEALHRRKEDPLGREGGAPLPPSVVEPGDVSTSLRRVGLQFDSRKTPVNVLVVDNVKSEPTPN